MRTPYVIPFVLALLVACAPRAVVETEDRSYVKEAVQRTVKVELTCEDGTTGNGSGVWVAPYTLATAHHVTDHEGCELSVDGLTASVRASDPEHDVALLTVPKPGTGHLRASESYAGMPVISVGYPEERTSGESTLAITRGWLTNRTQAGEWRMSAVIWYGNSGGPVFGPDGGLVGLSVAGMMTAGVYGQAYPVPGEYYVTPARHVYTLLGP